MFVPGEGGTPRDSWSGCAARFFKSWPDLRPKNVIFHTRFQTRPLKSILFFIPGLWAQIMLSLLRLERKQKDYSNPFRIRIFLFLSYSFGIEAINTFIHSVVRYKTIPDSRLKWAKCLPVFRPKTGQKPYPMPRHIARWLIYGSTPGCLC